ncbi:cysteine hydrolase [Actinacidiphila acididurans]|uniref:Cysteine hydrolase n=1 Tax=Actinacidiphila acididurans TaxID=2784346 RepID=A0ABS2TM42_9ACTN|nr:cysteine hydrolase [Actinacidiphila acididurans]MBM9504411.1 cysteine hydrolase [Actinacidiphila acididurans]
MDERNGLTVPHSLREACDPRRLALLVYDMQVGVLNQIEDRERVVERVGDVLEAARAAGVRTFFLRHVTLPAELMGVAQLRMWRAWQRAERAADVVSAFPPDAEQTQIVPELRPTEREAVVDKITMSAFEGTWLDIALRDCGVTTVAVVGVATEIGIEPTARHAADLGYVPVLVTDACGAGDPAAGERSLDALRFAGDALLTTSEEFRAVLAEHG